MVSWAMAWVTMKMWLAPVDRLLYLSSDAFQLSEPFAYHTGQADATLLAYGVQVLGKGWHLVETYGVPFQAQMGRHGISGVAGADDSNRLW